MECQEYINDIKINEGEIGRGWRQVLEGFDSGKPQDGDLCSWWTQRRQPCQCQIDSNQFEQIFWTGVQQNSRGIQIVFKFIIAAYFWSKTRM